MEVIVRRARTADVRGIRDLIDAYAVDRRLLSKPTVALYEAPPARRRTTRFARSLAESGTVSMTVRTAVRRS